MRTLIAIAVLQYLENSGVVFKELPDVASLLLTIGFILAIVQDFYWFSKD